MLGSKSVLAIIPARGGSKGIPRKNLADLGGHPLIAWSIAVARAAKGVDRVLVSTEDAEIAAMARRYGAEVADRPPELAEDNVGVHGVLIDLRERLWAEQAAADIAVVLEPSSPFRSPAMIEACLALLAKGHDSAATFAPCRTHPHRAWALAGDEPRLFITGANPWLRRQELPPAYEITGEVYAFRFDSLDPGDESLLVGRPGAVEIDGEGAVDVNTPRDLDLARLRFPSSPLAQLDPIPR